MELERWLFLGIVALLGVMGLGILGLLAWMPFQWAAVTAFRRALEGLGMEGAGATEGGLSRNLEPEAPGVRLDCLEEKGMSVELRLGVPVQALGGFHLGRRGTFHRFLQGLGLEGRLPTGEAVFDDRCHLDGDDPAGTVACFATAPAREAALALLSEGWPSIDLEGGLLEARWAGFRPRRNQDPAFLIRGGRHLAALARALPAGSEGAPPFRPRSARTAFIGVALGLGATVLLLSFSIGVPPRILDHGALAWRAVGTGILAALALLVLGAFRLRGRTDLAWTLATSCPFLLFCPFLAYLGALAADGALDRGPLTSHRVLVQRLTRSDDRTSRPLAVVASWRPGSPDETVPVPEDLWRALRPGVDRLDVSTRPGALGYEWVVSVAPAARQGVATGP